MENIGDFNSVYENNELVIKKNLEIIKAQLMNLLNQESMGGNAGRMKIDGELFSARGANGYIDKESGEIIVFGNTQDVPKELRENRGHFTLQVAENFNPLLGFNQKTFSQADVYNTKDISAEAEEVLRLTVDRWNEQQRSKAQS